MLAFLEVALFYLALLIFWGREKITSYWKRSHNLGTRKEVPFGYRGIPGIGFLPHFSGTACRKKLVAIKERYGSICKMRMGSFKCVWINDYKLIKEAWGNPVFCGRPDLAGISLRTKGFRGGIIFNDGEAFVEQRRFVMQTLRTIGLGKSLSEQFILEEIQDVISNLSCHGNAPISTQHLFNIPAFNIIFKIVTGGSRFSHDDPTMSKLVEVLNRNMALSDGACAAFFMPWLSKYFPGLIGWTKYVDDANFIFDFWVEFANKEMKKHEEGKAPTRNFLTEYCDKILNCEDPSSSFYGRTGVTSLATVLQDLFIAGSETTATTLQWICLYLAAFPKCQAKIFQEIESVFAENSANFPSVQVVHRNQMPYTEAFIKESLRYSTLAPLGMLHCALEDAELQGYFIPKGTILQMNVCATHFDKNYWENPEEFKPERFLNESQDKLRTGEIPGFLPFSLGKRLCPGAEVARQTLFLAMVSILRKFEIQAEGNELELNPKVGVSAVPFPHKLLFIKRTHLTC